MSYRLDDMTTKEKLRIVEMWNHMFDLETWTNGLIHVRYRKSAKATVHVMIYDNITEAADDMYHRAYRSADYECNMI